jgi:hypothetical protein
MEQGPSFRVSAPKYAMNRAGFVGGSNS